VTHLSLFSGIGGIDLASHWAGFETIQFVERDSFCQRVLTKNFQGVPIHDDVTTFDGRPFAGRTDLISAGFPCQPHSLAGKRMASDDERDLWGEVVRILGEAKPRWFLGENVPGLLSSESGRFFGRVVDDLASLGFSVGWCCYGASDVGAVHERERVFVLAYANNQPGLQTDTATSTIGKGWESWDDACRRDWGHIRNQEWDRVSVKPAVFRADDGVSKGLDESRLKALGNAVCPQQIYPVLKAIAEASR
jgi:DNA (cytosine-5)-methyltransferase 1